MSLRRELLNKQRQQSIEEHAQRLYRRLSSGKKAVEYRLKSNFDGSVLEWEGTLEQAMKDFGSLTLTAYTLEPIK
jgi:hypothetical protein